MNVSRGEPVRGSAPQGRIKVDTSLLRRLVGTRGAKAAVGELGEAKDGKVCWKLHPAYATWFWPLMHKATSLALYMPEALLEPIEEGDATAEPRHPTEAEKDKLLKTPERADDTIQVYTLVLKGKPPSVHKAFPTRTVSLSALRYCRQRVVAVPVVAAAKVD